MAAKRTRPPGRSDRPDIPRGPHPGCCKPYPYATFRDEHLVSIRLCHRGRFCKGFDEPMELEAFYAEVDRASARSGNGGDDR